MRTYLVCAVVLAAVCMAPQVIEAAESPALARSRSLYNAGDYEGAIDAASRRAIEAPWADAAALVIARSRLELPDPRQIRLAICRARSRSGEIGLAIQRARHAASRIVQPLRVERRAESDDHDNRERGAGHAGIIHDFRREGRNREVAVR